MSNMILKNGEIRTRPRQYNILPGTPDGNPILIVTSFLDANNIFHTVAVTSSGLWQLNRAWTRQPITAQKTWNLVGTFNVKPGPNFPAASSVFVNRFFWTNGGNNLFSWDGITSTGSAALWQASTFYLKGSIIIDSNGNLQVANNSGKSGTAHPVWGNTLAAQTVDNTGAPIPVITWTENGKNINTPS